MAENDRIEAAAEVLASHYGLKIEQVFDALSKRSKKAIAVKENGKKGGRPPNVELSESELGLIEARSIFSNGEIKLRDSKKSAAEEIGAQHPKIGCKVATKSIDNRLRHKERKEKKASQDWIEAGGGSDELD